MLKSEEYGDGRPYLGERTSLIGADDTNRAKSLDGLERLAQDLVLSHEISSNSQ